MGRAAQVLILEIMEGTQTGPKISLQSMVPPIARVRHYCRVDPMVPHYGPLIRNPYQPMANPLQQSFVFLSQVHSGFDLASSPSASAVSSPEGPSPRIS